MLNKVTLELEIPTEIDADASKILLSQTEFLVRFWRGVLTPFKEAGLSVPSLAMRNSVKKAASGNSETKEFFTKLIDHHLKFQPKADVPNQRTSIKALYETGKSAEELIELYEKSRAEYPLTTWHTVRYRLSKIPKDMEPEVSELQPEQINNIKERYANKTV
jgi:hypothetical protein